MALVGLGLLAGVGALVDYWPVLRDVPHVTVARLPAPARFAPLPAVDVRVPVAIAEVAQVEPVYVSGPVLGYAPELTGQPVLLVEPPAPVAVAITEPPVEPAITLVAAVEPSPIPGPDFDPSLVYQVGTSGDDSGLLADAVDMMKSTGSTIARGGAVTGASIIGAFRAVSGAVKRIKFF